MHAAGKTTRRGLIAAAALLYASDTTRALAADSPPKSDPQLLRELMALELLLATVYRRVLATELLSPRVQRVAHRVLEQEHVHARTVLRELSKLGGTPAPPLSRSDAIDNALHDLKVSASIEELHNEHDCVHLLLDLEAGAEGAYYKAISELRSLELTQMAVQILANEAEHQTALSEARRPGDASQAVPTSFVKGKS
jgi:hypothetical protein